MEDWCKHIEAYLVKYVSDDFKSINWIAWKSEKLQIVVKYQYVTNESQKVFEEKAHETILKDVLVPTYLIHEKKPKRSKWVLQPLCDTSDESIAKARKAFSDCWNKTDPFSTYINMLDYHGGNIGVYKGKPVFFDW